MWAVTSLWPQKVVCRSQSKRLVYIRDLEYFDFVRNVFIRMMIYVEKARVIEGE